MRRTTRTHNPRLTIDYISSQYVSQTPVKQSDSQQQQERLKIQQNRRYIKRSIRVYRSQIYKQDEEQGLHDREPEYMSADSSDRRVQLMKEIQDQNRKYHIPTAVINTHEVHDDNETQFSNLSRFVEQKLSLSRMDPRQLAKRIQVHQYERVKDKSYISTKGQQFIPLRKLDYMLSSVSMFSVISPQSYTLLVWNIFMEIAILFNLFEVPIAVLFTKAVFESQVQTVLGLGLNIVFLILLYIDTLFVRPAVAYYQKGKLISSRIDIIHNYIRLQLWLNLISILSQTIYLAVPYYQLIYVKLLFYCRVYNLYKIDQQVMHIMEFERISFGLYRLARLIVFFWYVTSIAGGIYFMIDFSYYQQHGEYFQNQQLWLLDSIAVGNLDLIRDFSWPVWYSYGLYWALQTASTVGYGDITPMNPPEVTYVVVAILLMTILFAFYLNTIWSILSTMEDISILNSQNWKRLVKYFKKNQISPVLKQKISNCLYQLWQDNVNSQIQQQIINKKITKQLREEFYVEYKQLFYKNVPIFKAMGMDQLPISAMKDLVDIIFIFTVLDKKYIYKQGDFDYSLYFLMKGDVRLTIDGSLLGQTVHLRHNFGIQSFILQIPRNHSAYSYRFSKLWKIQYEQFRKAVLKHRVLHQKFNQLGTKIKNQQQNQSTIQMLNYRCWHCSSHSHFLNQCPDINSWQDKLTVNRKNIQSYKSSINTGFMKQKRRYISRNQVQSTKIIVHRQNKKIYANSVEKVYIYTSFFPNFNIQLL